MNETDSCKSRGVMYSPLTTCTPLGLHPHFCRQLTAALGAACQSLETHLRAIAKGNLYFSSPCGNEKRANAPAISMIYCLPEQ